LGSDAVKVIAIRDAAIGLAGIGIAYLVRRAISGYRGQPGRAPSPQLIREPVAASGHDDEEVRGKANGTSTYEETNNATWSPLQFSIKIMLVLTLARASLLGVASAGGIRAAFGVFVLGLFLFVIVGCIRLVSTGDGFGGGL
jgi:hypothetical protein